MPVDFVGCSCSLDQSSNVIDWDCKMDWQNLAKISFWEF